MQKLARNAASSLVSETSFLGHRVFPLYDDERKWSSLRVIRLRIDSRYQVHSVHFPYLAIQVNALAQRTFLGPWSTLLLSGLLTKVVAQPCDTSAVF